jgi:beta-N-acetylhexosaminidase
VRLLTMDSLIHGVAQRLMVGMQGERFYDLLGVGIGGFIAFAPDVAALTAEQLQQRLAMLQASRLPGSPPLWLAVDQEGGPVERLTPAQCPSMPSFYALARLGADAVFSAINQQAAALASLGFNLNFTPCLDVNTEAANPVIGPRSFSADPLQVTLCGASVIRACVSQGVLPVGKHFPGHGGGVVDSHETLPTLPLAVEHLAPFHALIQHPQHPLPAVMMAHGYYPGACETPTTPASLSASVLQGLLRQQMGFDGLVITDDLQMGAITGDPAETAIQAMAAGNDVLLYREAGEREWSVLHAVVAALQNGRLSIRDHRAALQRIAQAKSLIQLGNPTLTGDAAALHTQGLHWAQQVLATQPKPLLNKPFHLLHPHTPDLHGYRQTPPDTLLKALAQVGLKPDSATSYRPFQPLPVCQPHHRVFVASHLTRCPEQRAFARQVLSAGGLVVTPGWLPEDGDYPGVVLLPGYQPAALQALAQWLVQT